MTNGNFTLFVISNHKKQIIKNKKNGGSRVGCFDDQVEEVKNNKTKPNTGSGDKADVTDLAVYASGRTRVEHITQQVSSDYQVEVLQCEGTVEPWGCKVRVKTDPTCHDI